MSDRYPVRVILKRGRSKPFWLGHPWVFSGAIHKVEGAGELGGPCLVEDERGNVVGSGYYNPQSKIAVRLLQHRRSTDLDFDPTPLDELLRERIEAALGRRRSLGLPDEHTDSYRVVNAEGDLVPGLIVDKLGRTAVIQIGSRHIYDAREQVAETVRELLAPDRIVSSISEDASRIEAIPVGIESLPGAGGKVVGGPADIQENGVRYAADLEGQKTGFYFDQRENRARFAWLSGGQRVLDLYCYAGAFGLNALMGGAEHVVAVDSSGPALEAAAKNVQLNGFEDRWQGHNVDAMTFLKEANARGQTWDRIVCDPPKFARGRSHVDEALKKYTKLNTLAMTCLAPGGLLLTCSCSQHVSRDNFLRMLTEAGHRLRRSVCVHGVWGQAPDHPFSVVAQEGDYLKAALVSVA